MEWLANSPILATSGVAGFLVFLGALAWRFQRNYVEYGDKALAKAREDYDAEVEARQKDRDDARKREAVLRAELDDERVQHRKCVSEREGMRIAMRVNGVPFNPEDWNT